MRDGSRMPPSALATAKPRQPTTRLVPQISLMLRVLRASPQWTEVLLLGFGLFAVIATTAFAQTKLNAWNQPFYDAVAKKDFQGFVIQLAVFGVIAGTLLLLNVAQVWLNQATKVKLREGLVCDLLNQWLKSRRALRLAHAREMGANPDQRIQEDARYLSELSADLGIGLLQSSLLLGIFSGVLWSLSGLIKILNSQKDTFLGQRLRQS
jgi:putative ATP-binding cassette transporter